MDKRDGMIAAVRPLVFFQVANFTAVGEFHVSEHDVPAVAMEIADALGVKAYGQPAHGGPSLPSP